MKILLLGAAGQLGRCVQDALHDGPYELVALTRADLDLSDQSQLHQAFAHHRPAVVINAAAYNAVDLAESDPDNAYRVNAQGPADLAEHCLSTDTYLIHFSTDYVFDGKPQTGQAPLTGQAPYPEQAFTHPLSVYGASKLAGDQAVLASGCRATLIRTSWLFSEYGSNFVKTMLRLANEGQSIQVVTDQLGCPTYAGDLAQVVKQLLDWDGQGGRQGSTGLFHYGGNSVVSWYGFAQQILSRAEALGLLQQPTRLIPICANDFKSLAQRPDFSALDSRLLTQQLGLAASDWQRALDLVLVRLQSTRLQAP